MNRTLLTLSSLLSASLLLAQADNYPEGSTVDDFTVTDTQGHEHHLDGYISAGKYVILDFFFYNCGPCQAHAPYYSELYQTYGCNGGDLICIEVDYGDSDALAEAFAEDFAPGFAHPPVIGSGSGNGLVSTFGVGAFPTFCLIGPGREMLNNDIWPVSNMSTFVAAFPAGSGITAQPCAVGIEEAGTPHFTSVYPTLTSGVITLSCSGTHAQQVEVVVYDLLGQPVPDLAVTLRTGTERTLDLGALANGQYVLKLIADGRVTDTERVAVAR